MDAVGLHMIFLKSNKPIIMQSKQPRYSLDTSSVTQCQNALTAIFYYYSVFEVLNKALKLHDLYNTKQKWVISCCNHVNLKQNS